MKRFIGLLLLLTFSSFAHADDVTVSSVIGDALLGEVRERYEQGVKPIFERACFDCHSQNTVYPWYHWIPGIRQLIDEDVEEGREHLDMTNGFPFQSKEETNEVLKEIKEEISEGKMPLPKYLWLHWSARLSDEEKQLIYFWVDDALEKVHGLKESPEEAPHDPH